MLSSCRERFSLSTTLATMHAWKTGEAERKACPDRAGRQTLESSYGITGSNRWRDVYLLECELTSKPSKVLSD